MPPAAAATTKCIHNIVVMIEVLYVAVVACVEGFQHIAYCSFVCYGHVIYFI